MSTTVKIVRFWLPGLMFVVGAVMVVARPDIIGVEGAAMMLGGGLGVVVSDRLYRMGLKGEQERDEEQDARGFLDRYGVWPDQASPELRERAEREGAWPGAAPSA
ncbi:hypothetical protein [Patulibacter defluvii]|uniref:hypothetical protein n=1 Tax=Patulibacter defluvii TaxID=3095358 RepID=UPI002A7568E2|nr:hypothetical protein [Patulibacter sp. DM4]